MKNSAPATIDEYIAGFPENVQKILEQVRITIKNAAPQAEETISYAMPTFKLNGNLVHFAAFANHVGFYATPTGNTAFTEDLYAYKTGKGSIQFPIDKPMPLELISKIVTFRVVENLEKASKKTKSKKTV